MFFFSSITALVERKRFKKSSCWLRREAATRRRLTEAPPLNQPRGQLTLPYVICATLPTAQVWMELHRTTLAFGKLLSPSRLWNRKNSADFKTVQLFLWHVIVEEGKVSQKGFEFWWNWNYAHFSHITPSAEHNGYSSTQGPARAVFRSS